MLWPRQAGFHLPACRFSPHPVLHAACDAPKPLLPTDTPAEVLLSLLSDMAERVDPDPNKMAIARAAILKRDDLYRPFDLSAVLTAKHLEVNRNENKAGSR